jgi:hypothetical protein
MRSRRGLLRPVRGLALQIPPLLPLINLQSALFVILNNTNVINTHIISDFYRDKTKTKHYLGANPSHNPTGLWVSVCMPQNTSRRKNDLKSVDTFPAYDACIKQETHDTLPTHDTVLIFDTMANDTVPTRFASENKSTTSWVWGVSWVCDFSA